MFYVTKRYSNGYRCSCCRHTWSDSDKFDDEQEAVNEVQTEGTIGGELELVEVEVEDGETGEKVAWGTLFTTEGYGKYSGYNYSCWSGYRPDTGGFEVIYTQNGKKVTDKTWAECREEVKAAHYTRKRKEAQDKLEKAQREVAFYDKELGEGAQADQG